MSNTFVGTLDNADVMGMQDELTPQERADGLFADSLPKCKYRLPRLYHPDAKTIAVCRHNLMVILHIDGEYVIVDKIMPSCMITYLL